MCFTYGTWFALRGLAAVEKTYHNCEAVREAVAFLLQTQLVDGGWGESYRSCPDKVVFEIHLFIFFHKSGTLKLSY